MWKTARRDVLRWAHAAQDPPVRGRRLVRAARGGRTGPPAARLHGDLLRHRGRAARARRVRAAAPGRERQGALAAERRLRRGPDARRRDARRPRRPAGGAARARLGCFRGLRAHSGAARADARDRAARQGGKQVAREDQRRLDHAPRRAADDRFVQRDRARAARSDPEGAGEARVGSSRVRRQAHERRRALGAGSGPRAAARAAAAFDFARAAAPVPPGAVRTDARPRSGRSGREGPRGPSSDARRNAAAALGAEHGRADPRPGLGDRDAERARLARRGAGPRA